MSYMLSTETIPAVFNIPPWNFFRFNPPAPLEVKGTATMAGSSRTWYSWGYLFLAIGRPKAGRKKQLEWRDTYVYTDRKTYPTPSKFPIVPPPPLKIFASNRTPGMLCFLAFFLKNVKIYQLHEIPPGLWPFRI